ncbi:hypothetical protein PU01_19380 [Hafnia alvei]|nr:hypothetical protein PU01_19380 [Hafnia alvei]
MLLMAGMAGMAGIILMEATDQTVVILFLLRAGRVVRAEPIQTGRENFIFPGQNSNAIPGSRMQ